MPEPADAPDRTVGYDNLKADAVAEPSSATGSRVFADPHRPGSSVFKGTKSRSGTVSSGFGRAAVAVDLAPESLIGPYEVLDEIGRGGMGVVYKARHIHLNRIVALKMIVGGTHLNAAHLERFRLEAEAIARLHHPSIVQVFDVGEHNDAPYMALELVDGGNLAKKAGGKPMAAKTAAQIVETISRGMHEAHAAGVIHRDLKPANVLLTLDGQPKVSDFGLAKDMAQGEEGQTHAGSILGTPSYMAPEQAAGRVHDIGPGTDVYALGAILYELLTGRPPFRGESPIATIRMVLDGEAVAPRALQAGVPRDLDTICLKALQKPTHRRYATAEELAEDLRRFLDGEPIHARPVGPAERLAKWVRRKPARAGALGTGILACAAMLALGVWSYLAVTDRAARAEAAEQRASTALDRGTKQLIRLNVANGARLLDDQDALGSVLWFAEALRLEIGGPDREAMHRTRLGAVLARCPVPEHVWLHEGAMTDARTDAAGARVITAADDGTARVWDAATGKAVCPPLEHGAAVKFAALSPDGTAAATAGTDGILRLWDAATGKPRFQAALAVQFTGLAFTADGTRVGVCGAAGRVRVWDAATGAIVSTITAGAFNDRATGLAFAPDSKLYVVGSADGTARAFDTATSAPAGPAVKHAGPVIAVAFAPDSKRFATASGDGTAMVWDAATGQAAMPAAVRHSDAVRAIAFSPDGKRLVTGGADNTAQVWDTATGRPVGHPALHASAIHIVGFGPDGRRFLTGSDDNAVRVWDADTGNPTAPPFRGNATPVAAVIAPDGHHLLIASGNRMTVYWELITAVAATDAKPLVLPADAVRTAASPDGARVVTFGGGQAVRVRRADDREALTPPLRTGGSVTCAAFDPDGKHVATGDAEGAVMLWRTDDGKAAWEKPVRHASRVVALAFAPDGAALATTGEDNTAGVWDVATGEARVPPIRLGATGMQLAFAADGAVLFARTMDGHARAYDAATGEPLTPPGTTFDVRLTPDPTPTDDLLSVGRVLAGLKLNDGGGILPLDAADRRAEFDALKTKYPARFEAAPAAIAAWYRGEAAAAEAAGQWFAAGWHLDRLTTLTPDDADLRRRRGAAAAQLGDWKRAAADADKAVRLRPDTADNWHQRGIARGQLGDWSLAAADFAVAVELRQDSAAAAGLAALVALDAGDAAGYREACRDALGTYHGTANPAVARRAAWACVAGAEAGIDPARLLELAAVGRAGGGWFGETVHAAALLRAGRADDAAAAVKDLGAAVEERPAAWAVYAAALGKLGKPEAAAWRAKAAAWLAAAAKPGAAAPSFAERVGVAALIRE